MEFQGSYLISQVPLQARGRQKRASRGNATPAHAPPSSSGSHASTIFSCRTPHLRGQNMRVQLDENASKTARMVEKRPGQGAIDLHEGQGRKGAHGSSGRWGCKCAHLSPLPLPLPKRKSAEDDDSFRRARESCARHVCTTGSGWWHCSCSCDAHEGCAVMALQATCGSGGTRQKLTQPSKCRR